METLALGTDRGNNSPAGYAAGAFVFAAEALLRAEVDRFAASFFQLAPPVRAAGLVALSDRAAAFPTLKHRLRKLQAGVKVVVPQSGNGEAVLDLAQHLAELFTLLPNDRARRRRFPDERFHATIPQWRQAAAIIRQQLPSLMVLDPNLIESLTAAPPLEPQPERQPARQTVPRTVEQPPVVRPPRSVHSDIRVNTKKPLNRGGVKSDNQQVFIWIAVVIFFFLIRSCMGASAVPKPNKIVPPRYHIDDRLPPTALPQSTLDAPGARRPR